MAGKVDITSSIIAIAQEVTETDSSLTDHVRSFLKLRDILSDSSLNFHSLTGAHYLIWKCDLLHVLVEELRVDFLQVDVGNGWYTGVILGRLLSNVFSNIKPLEGREGEEEEEAERNEEFYEMLLPTAADSFLILANNIHESDNSSNSIYLDQFEAVTDALIRLCFAHNDCIKRVIESSYLLHLLVSDNVDYSLSIMRFLQELVKIDGEIIECVSTKILESILDELVYKVGGPHKELAITGLRLLAVLSSYSVIVVELISEKYRGFSLLLEKWSQTSMDASMVKFVSTLLERVKASDEDSSLQKAAVFIQAGWRGYATRKRLKRMRKGFVLLQRLVRKRRRDKEMKKQRQTDGLRSREIRKMREEREHEMALLESMPASSVAKYLTDQKNSAAIIIQHWWKSKRRNRELVTGQLERNRSAVIIQRAYKKFIKRKDEPSQEARTSEQSISSVKNPDRTNLASMLDWFYKSRAKARDEERKRALLLTQLSSQCNLLLNMPSLADCTVGIETMYLSGSSQTVASMAEKAHSEKIASLNLPLWKRSHEKDRV